jgi:hypothetical protein
LPPEQIHDVSLRFLDRIFSIVGTAGFVTTVALYRPTPALWDGLKDHELDATVSKGNSLC